MLVLTRRVGEEIVIGGNIFIRVTMLGRDRVRLGITAPGGIRVDRLEVHALPTRSDVESSEIIDRPPNS
jgi:carbon storage regulator